MGEKRIPPPDFRAQLRAFDGNASWAHEHAKDLLEHVGKYVAVDGRRLVGVAASEEKLRRLARLSPTAYVTFVYPPDLAWQL